MKRDGFVYLDLPEASKVARLAAWAFVAALVAVIVWLAVTA